MPLKIVRNYSNPFVMFGCSLLIEKFNKHGGSSRNYVSLGAGCYGSEEGLTLETSAFQNSLRRLIYPYQLHVDN